ncbi:DUF2244 domain-containing protein [Alteromonas sp. H39]|uniref:DUF2244 domain-containing protein n=1 Tax=Alteromonas sp. H39 TaxID=3389876 RepID=UPI0039E0EE36
MLITRVSEHALSVRLYPNRSATWQQTKWLIALMGVVIGIIALGWLIAGVWVILPFAGVETALLAYLFYRVSKSTYQYQDIIIMPDAIQVSVGKREPLLTLPRHSSHLAFYEGENEWHLPELRLISPSRTIVIGEFLNHADRHRLRHILADAGIMVCRKNWWKHD